MPLSRLSLCLVICCFLSVLSAVLLCPASAQSTSPLSDPASGFYWFQPNATAISLSSSNTVNASTNSSYAVASWTDSQQQATLYAAANSTLPLFDPVGLTLNFNSSALVASTSFTPSQPSTANVTILVSFNLAATCTFPGCVLLSTAARNVTGSLLLSTVPVPSALSPFQQSTQFYLSLTLVTSPQNSVSVQSAIPLSYSQWQYVTVIIPPSLLQANATVALRTTVGLEALTFVLSPNSTDSLPATVALSAFTIGDTGGLHALYRDVAIGFLPLTDSVLDAIIAFFYSLYALTFPPMRMTAPAVQLINVTGSQAIVQLSWSPPFSPTSPILSYQLRVTSNTSVPLTAAQSLLLTFNNLTTFQYMVRRDGSSAYSFAVTACNADFPYPPVVAPLLYSVPYIAPSGNITVNSTVSVLSPPPVPNAPQVYLASAPNITVYVGFPTGLNLSCALTTSPCYPASPLTSIALFYTNDQSGSLQNFTWVTQPVWSFSPSTWSWYALTTGLSGNQFYAFKVQVSNAAGGVNTSVSSGFLLPGSSNAVSSTAASSGTTSTSAAGSNTSGTAGQTVRSSSSSTGSTAATGTRIGITSSSVTSSNTALSSAHSSSSESSTPNTTVDSSSSSSTASTAATLSEVSSSSSSPMFPSMHSSSSSYWPNTTVSDGSSFGASSNDSLIAGVIIGAFGGILLLVVLTWCCFFRKRQLTNKKPSPPHSAAGSTYASPRPSASLPPAVSYDRGVVSPNGGMSNRRTPGKKEKVAGGRGGTALSVEGDMEMAELEAEWEGDDVGHQMKPQQQPSTAHAFRR